MTGAAAAIPDVGGRSPAPARWPDETLSEALAAAAATVVREQLPTGELPTYVRGGDGRLEYRRSPLLSSFVHDALAVFDPASEWMERELLDLLTPAVRRRLFPVAARMRRKLRAFLAWDEEAHGTWRLLGRGSGIGPDADVTACAACAVLQARAHGGELRWRRHVASLERLRRDADDEGVAEAANVVRFLALIGEDVEDDAERLLDRIAAGGLDEDSHRYTGWIARLYCATRAWGQGALPGRDELRATTLPGLLDRQEDDGSFGGPLDTALGLLCLVELDRPGPAASRAMAALAASRRAVAGGWPYQAAFTHGGGSCALSTTLAMAALARAAVDAAEGTA